MIRPIVIWPSPVLTRPTQEVTAFDHVLHQLLADMAETMAEARGIGIAANQIGVGLRVAIVGRGDGTFVEMVNPRVVAHRGEIVRPEACLSVPEEEEPVKRHLEVDVTYQDRAGTRQEVAAAERFAHVVQHEVDHLDGLVYVSRLSGLKRDIIRRRMRKLSRND